MCGVDEHFHITEELLALVPMKGTTKGCDIYREVKLILEKFNLKMEKLHGISTDGALAMVGSKQGAVSFYSKECSDLITIHCILHQENLCAKIISMEHVMKVVVKVVNFLRAGALNHRQFREFLSDMDSQYDDVIYFTQVRWLSAGKMLKRVYDLHKEILMFLHHRNETQLAAHLENNEWVSDLCFLVDMTQHLNELNVKLQGKNNMINNLFYILKSFQIKLSLWQSQLCNGQLANFPTMNSFVESNIDKYASLVLALQNEFN